MKTFAEYFGFILFTFGLAKFVRDAFSEQRTRALWHKRLNNVFFSSFHPSKTEADYVRFKRLNIAVLLMLCGVWCYFAFTFLKIYF